MLMLIIANTEGRNAVAGVRPIQFNNARQALEAVKGQLKMHVATIHAETVHVDDTISLVVGFVGRGNAAETVLANVMAAHGDATAALLERCGVIGAYQVPETDDAAVLNGYADSVYDNLATYLPTEEGAPFSGEPLTLDGLELLAGSPLKVVASSDGAQLGRPSPQLDTEQAETEQPEVETPVVAEAQPATHTEIETKETAMSNMPKAELMRTARQLHADLTATVPNFQPIEIAFADASRLRRYCGLSLSDMDPALLAEVRDRAEEVCECLRELAALASTQDDELEAIPTVADSDDEDFSPAPDAALGGDDEDFDEVDTLVETDATFEGADVDTVDAELVEDADEEVSVDLNDAEVLAEKLPAVFLLTQGRLDEIDGMIPVVAAFALNFAIEQGVDFNGFDDTDVEEAAASGELINVVTLLDDADWLDAASFDLLYELDGNLTDVASAADFDVQGEVDQSGIDLDADVEANEELIGETDDNDWGEDDEDEDEEEEAEADLQLVQVSIVPRLVLNLVTDYNGHIYTKEQRQALMAMPTESGRVLNLAYGISGTDRTTGSQGAYIRAIGRTAKALGQLANATVLLPASHANVTADKLAATVAAAATGTDIHDLLSNVLADLQGIEVDEDGNVLIGFADDEGDETEDKIALTDLCDFDVKYSMMREHDFGPATIEVTALLNMRMPILGFAKYPEQIAARLASLADKQFDRTGVEVYPAITFNAVDRIFNRTEEFSDRNVACLTEVISALVAQVNVEESPWAGAVVASHRAVTETGLFGIGLLVDDTEAEQYIPLHEVVDIDAYASVGNDAAAILCSPIGESLFNMGGDTTVLLTRSKDDTEEEEETEMDDAE